MRLVSIFIALTVVSIGCQSDPVEFPPTPTAITWPTPLPTATPVVFPTPLPTATPAPFPTPLPTATPALTATPQVVQGFTIPDWPTPLPTSTPRPTATPQPTATPAPALYPPTISDSGISFGSSSITIEYSPSLTWGGEAWEFYEFQLWYWSTTHTRWTLQATRIAIGPTVHFSDRAIRTRFRVEGRACTEDWKLCGPWSGVEFTSRR